jgi:hypothetical protein
VGPDLRDLLSLPAHTRYVNDADSVAANDDSIIIYVSLHAIK